MTGTQKTREDSVIKGRRLKTSTSTNLEAKVVCLAGRAACWDEFEWLNGTWRYRMLRQGKWKHAQKVTGGVAVDCRACVPLL